MLSDEGKRSMYDAGFLDLLEEDEVHLRKKIYNIKNFSDIFMGIFLLIFVGHDYDCYLQPSFLFR